MKNLGTLLAIVALFFTASTLPVAAGEPAIELSKQALLDDFDQFVETVTSTHPEPYLFTPKEQFWRVIQHNRQLIDETTTKQQFIWYLSEIIANLGCGHSGLGWFNQEYDLLSENQFFPIEARFIGDELYVTDPLINAEQVSPGEEIIAINGVTVEDIKKQAFAHIASQAKIATFRTIILNSYMTSYVPYVLGFPKSYTVTLSDNKTSKLLMPLNHYQAKPRYHRISSQSSCDGVLCFEMRPEKSTAVMTIRSFAFYGEKLPEFQEFIESAFERLADSNTQSLIVDLRFNDGGPSQAGKLLLQHLLLAPFIYYAQDSKPMAIAKNGFSGDLYVLIDGEGGSTTGHVMSIMKDRKRAVIIGEELGSNHQCTANQKQYKLANTGISFLVARTTFATTVKGLPLDKGIMPEHFIQQSIGDYLAGTDTVMEYAFEQILVNRNSRSDQER